MAALNFFGKNNFPDFFKHQVGQFSPQNTPSVYWILSREIWVVQHGLSVNHKPVGVCPPCWSQKNSKPAFNQASIKVLCKLLQHSVGPKLWPLQQFNDRYFLGEIFFRFPPRNQCSTKKFPKKPIAPFHHDPNPTFKAIKTMLHLSQKVGSFYEEISVSQTIPPWVFGLPK